MIKMHCNTVKVWTGGLTEEMADCTASLLRAWLPSGISGAWAEPEWESLQTPAMTRLARPTSVAREKLAA
jgi:hypothetical protein